MPSTIPPFAWPGGSMVVDYDGRILAQVDPGPGEKIVVGPIDLAALLRRAAAPPWTSFPFTPSGRRLY